MGNTWDHEAQSESQRPFLAEREGASVHIAMHENARDQQQQYRAKQREVAQHAVEDFQDLVPPLSDKVSCEFNRASKIILDAIRDFLSFFLEIMDRQAVM